MRGLLRVLMVCCCMSVSCKEELGNEDQTPSECYTVNFDLRQPAVSRSSIAPDESRINDFNIYVYERGVLANSLYMEDCTDVAVVLNAGMTYNIYILANVGRVEPFLKEEDFMENYTFSITGLSEIGEYLPFAGSLKDVYVDRSGQRFSIILERLVSKVVFSVDKSALVGLEVTSVRLCQSAMSVDPFCEGGSSALVKGDVADGDFCNECDLEKLNNAGSVCFYALENCQGILLPDNSDPWEKIPARLDDKAELCTYLEVECRFDGSGLCSGDIVYRLFLGQDNCSDFNLVRNSVLNVSLCLTVDGMKEALSWRVTSDYSLNEGYAYGWISLGNHSEDDLYVGEKFEYSLWLSEQMMSYIGQIYDDCEVCFVPYDHEESGVTFSEIKEGRNGECYVEATCIRPSEGQIFLKDKNGRFLAQLSDFVCVKQPVISFSCGESISCDVNGHASWCHVYFLDSKMFNLNSSCGCGYDLSVFDMQVQPDDGNDAGLMSMMDAGVFPGTEADDGPVMEFRLSCHNSGTDHNCNIRLIGACCDGTDLIWKFSESASSISKELPVELSSRPIEMTLVDNAWAGYGDSQLAVIVDNPSRLPLSVDCWQFVTVNKECDTSLMQEAAAKVENELRISEMEYVVNEYPESQLPVYGSHSSFVSERNAYGSNAVEEGDCLVYILDGIDTDDIIAALTYHGWGYDTMSHHFYVSYSDGTPVQGLSVNDCLSDGSSAFAKKYGLDNLNDRGIWLYDEEALILAPEDLFDSYPGLTPANLKAMRWQTPVIGEMNYDKDAEQFHVQAYHLGSEGLVLDSISTASADGYVRTYPDGTWRDGVDNNCHEKLIKTCSAFPVLYSGGVVADGNIIKDVFSLIYSNTYYDSWNKIGSANNYMHSAHPTSLTMTMSFRISDRSDKAAYLFKPTFLPYVVYKHAQEGVEYKVPSEFIHKTFKFVDVKKK